MEKRLDSKSQSRSNRRLWTCSKMLRRPLVATLLLLTIRWAARALMRPWCRPCSLKDRLSQRAVSEQSSHSDCSRVSSTSRTKETKSCSWLTNAVKKTCHNVTMATGVASHPSAKAGMRTSTFRNATIMVGPDFIPSSAKCKAHRSRSRRHPRRLRCKSHLLMTMCRKHRLLASSKCSLRMIKSIESSRGCALSRWTGHQRRN